MAGGGSGGHLCPGLAVAEALGHIDPQSQVLLLCTERDIDAKFLSASRFRYMTQPVVPIRLGLRTIADFWRRWRQSVRLCQKLFRQNEVAAVLGLGGFASGPALKVAHQMGLPAALLNPDAVPGKANLWGSRHVDRIFVQWEVAKQHFGAAASKCVVTGCPVTEERVTVSESVESAHGTAKHSLGLDTDKRTLVIVGGSMGGRNVNEAVVHLLAGNGDDHTSMDMQGWQVLHLTGTEDCNWVEQAYRKAGVDAIVLAFTERIGAVLRAADIVIGRAGASTLAELTALGVAGILLPYPYHRDQHQWRNAHVLADAGAAMIVKDCCDAQQTATRLRPVLLELLASTAKREEMAAAAQAIGRIDAAKAVAEQLNLMAARR